MKKNKLYRLTIVEDETHKRISSYRFSRISATLLLSSAAVIIFGIIYCIVAFTPLRSTIPGYPDEYSKNIAVQNAMKIDSLENIITRWEFYVNNLSAVLGGEGSIKLEDIVRDNSTKFLKKVSDEKMREADSLLRIKVKEGQK